MADLEATLAAARAMLEDLGQKRERAGAEAARLERVKEPMILPAATEGQGRQRALDKINLAIAEQQLRCEDLEVAIGQARGQVEAIERAIADAADAGRREAVAALYAQLREVDRRFDEQAQALAATVAERARLIGQIQKTAGKRVGELTWKAGRGGKGVLTRALKAAGLSSQDVDFGWTGSVKHDLPLAQLGYPEIEALLGGEREAA